MITPVFTEKSLKLAKEGKYTFLVPTGADKSWLKSEISRTFGVKVIDIKTTKQGPEKGRSMRGNKFSKVGAKKAVVTLKEGDKIDLFEEGKK